MFIQHNNLAARFRNTQARQVFTIAETGFGSGLNFLCAWQCWQTNAHAQATLHFLSVEKFPITKVDLSRALNLWPELKQQADALLSQYPPVDARGFHRLKFSANVTLTLIFSDAESGLRQLLPIDKLGPQLKMLGYSWNGNMPYTGQIDAWFLDGFAPTKNPEMWSSTLFEAMSRLSKSGKTTLATFTASGSVRRDLQAAGFKLEKPPGFGKKREMLAGVFSPEHQAKQLSNTDSTAFNDREHNAHANINNANAYANSQPRHRCQADPSWHLCSPQQNSMHDGLHHIAIIGAGLAGCHSAFALAQRGYRVTLIDQNNIASGASGNPQGILYSKLSQSQGVFIDYNLSAYLFACRFYEREGFFNTVGDQSGVLQLAENPQQNSAFQSIVDKYPHSADFVRRLTPDEASERAGVCLASSALWYPQAGWLRPTELCKSLVAHCNIQVIEGMPVSKLNLKAEHWELLSSSETPITHADAVIVACANSAKQFEQCQSLPTKPIRGQISHVAQTSKSEELKTVLCGTGYIGPHQNQIHCLGATFNLKSTSDQLSEDDHRQNLENAHKMSADFCGLTPPLLEHGRVSFRCSSPDYLPLIGPVANEALMLERFAGYRSNLKRVIDAPGAYWPNLYINIGHGSKGLCYTPICAELLACIINNEPLPLPRDLVTHIHSARFLIRDLARNKR